jgi:hypothetical protein
MWGDRERHLARAQVGVQHDHHFGADSDLHGPPHNFEKIVFVHSLQNILKRHVSPRPRHIFIHDHRRFVVNHNVVEIRLKIDVPQKHYVDSVRPILLFNVLPSQLAVENALAISFDHSDNFCATEIISFFKI